MVIFFLIKTFCRSAQADRLFTLKLEGELKGVFAQCFGGQQLTVNLFIGAVFWSSLAKSTSEYSGLTIASYSIKYVFIIIDYDL